MSMKISRLLLLSTWSRGWINYNKGKAFGGGYVILIRMHTFQADLMSFRECLAKKTTLQYAWSTVGQRSGEGFRRSTYIP